MTIAAGLPDELPVLAGRQAGKAYLCQHGRCQLPAASLAELRGQLAGLRSNL